MLQERETSVDVEVLNRKMEQLSSPSKENQRALW